MPRTCTVPLGTLIDDPYWMNSGQHVYARVMCFNTLGGSIWSEVGNDAIIPRAPDSCLNLHLVSRNGNSIIFGWTDGFEDGGAPITCYEINYQQISGANTLTNQIYTDEICSTQVDVDFQAREYAARHLTNGEQYEFSIISKNVAGESAPCVITFMACVAPIAPTGVEENYDLRSGTNLAILW